MRKQSTASLRAELDELRDAFEKNSALLKRINSRTLVQEHRARQADAFSESSVDQAPNESKGAWKDRMRRQLAMGAIRHKP